MPLPWLVIANPPGQRVDKFQQALGRCFNDGDRLDMSHLQKLLAEGKRNRDALGS